MKKIILILLTILPFFGWAMEGKFLLKGKIGKGSAKAKIYLNYKSDGEIKTISVSCTNGVFEFRGMLSEPKLARLVLDKNGVGLEKLGKNADVLVFFLEDGNITVNATGDLKNAVFTGSKLNEENKKFMELLKPAQASINAVISEFYNAPENKQKDVKYKAEMNVKLKRAGLKRRKMLNDYVQAHPTSFLSLQILMDAVDEKVEAKKIKVQFDSLSPSLRDSPSGKALKAKLRSA